MIKRICIALAFLALVESVPAMQEGGLILSGIDTLHIPDEKGFDFVQQQACSTMSNDGCILHFDFQWYAIADAYVLFVRYGHGTSPGHMNLDSVRFAPSDSILSLGEMGRAGEIPPDSLEDYIGTVYVIKTGEDPRRGYPFYAKLKILDFNVIDAENHEVEMVFLWAYNRSGPIDLRTTNLDTYDLTTDTYKPVARSRKHALPAAARNARVRFVPGAGVRVVGPGVRGSNRERVFDVRGRGR
jgi:hypothetical protein